MGFKAIYINPYYSAPTEESYTAVNFEKSPLPLYTPLKSGIIKNICGVLYFRTRDSLGSGYTLTVDIFLKIGNSLILLERYQHAGSTSYVVYSRSYNTNFNIAYASNEEIGLIVLFYKYGTSTQYIQDGDGYYAVEFRGRFTVYEHG